MINFELEKNERLFGFVVEDLNYLKDVLGKVKDVLENENVKESDIVNVIKENSPVDNMKLRLRSHSCNMLYDKLISEFKIKAKEGSTTPPSMTKEISNIIYNPAYDNNRRNQIIKGVRNVVIAEYDMIVSAFNHEVGKLLNKWNERRDEPNSAALLRSESPFDMNQIMYTDYGLLQRYKDDTYSYAIKSIELIGVLSRISSNYTMINNDKNNISVVNEIHASLQDVNILTLKDFTLESGMFKLSEAVCSLAAISCYGDSEDLIEEKDRKLLYDKMTLMTHRLNKMFDYVNDALLHIKVNAKEKSEVMDMTNLIKSLEVAVTTGKSLRSVYDE